MEGKEVRFGIANSALWATVTTDTSCGAVNSMHDSYTPLGRHGAAGQHDAQRSGFRRRGSGMYGMIIFIILAVFIAGLMVGRTPEYLGKKIEAYEVKMAMLVALIFPLDHPGLHVHLGAAAVRHLPASPIPGRTGFSRDPVRLYRRGGQQRLCLCRIERQHALVQHSRSASTC